MECFGETSNCLSFRTVCILERLNNRKLSVEDIQNVCSQILLQFAVLVVLMQLDLVLKNYYIFQAAEK